MLQDAQRNVDVFMQHLQHRLAAGQGPVPLVIMPPPNNPNAHDNRTLRRIQTAVLVGIALLTQVMVTYRDEIAMAGRALAGIKAP